MRRGSQLRGTGIVNSAMSEAYGDVFDRLERDEVRYVVIGGAAVVLHGYVRPVADLDIAIDPAPDEAACTMRALARSGFVPSLPLPLSMLSMLRMFDPSHREVDVLVRYHIPFDDLWAASERLRAGDGVARVTSLDHLLRAKRVTSRPSDLRDIEGSLALSRGKRAC